MHSRPVPAGHSGKLSVQEHLRISTLVLANFLEASSKKKKKDYKNQTNEEWNIWQVLL